MSDMRKLIRDIDRGLHLEKNLPIYGKMLTDTYLNYAAVELTLSAYILSECKSEYEEISEDEKAVYDTVMHILRRVLEDQKDDLEEIMAEAEKIRGRITEVMETFTSYTDRLICYDRVLGRMKLKYTEDKELLKRVKGINEDEFISRIMMFLASSKDKSITRDRLQELIGQIPVHMTKNKFLQRVEESVKLYNGGDASALDEFVYMIRSVAMLNDPGEGQMFDGEIRGFVKQLEETEFAELTGETYQELLEQMEAVSGKLYRITDFYYSMQKVINGIYALCLAKKHDGKKEEVFEICMDILGNVAEGIHDEDSLVRIEGKIENYVETSSYLEAVLFEVSASCGNVLAELGISQDFEDYIAIVNLLSDSLFIDINRGKDNRIVDAEQVKKVSASLTDELSRLLGGLKKPVKKAVMTSVLERLPAGFSDGKEIEEYIRVNLFGCQDFSEKGVVLLELEKMMEEAAEWSEV